MTASSSSALKLTSLTGNYYDCCPVFIEKSELVLTASGSTIHALSSKTGDLIGTFSEHSTPITSMKQIVSKDYNVLQILSASLDGTLCLWNLKTFKPVRSYKIASPIYGAVVLPGPVDIFSLLSNKESKIPKGSSGSTEVYLVINSGSEEKSGDIFTVKMVGFDLLSEKMRDFSRAFSFSSALQQHPSADVLQVPSLSGAAGAVDTYIVIASSKRLTLYAATGSGQKIVLPSDKRGNITCVAVNQTRGLIVTGHEYGELTVWRDMAAFIAQYNSNNTSNDFNKASLQPTKTTFHWHAHAVSAVNISSDGTSLFSCGLEGVLVVWNISGSTRDDGSKTFFPRLGAPATHLTSCLDVMGGVKVAVTSTDNALRIINTATMKEEWTLKALCVSSRKDSVLKRHFNKDGTLKKAASSTTSTPAPSSSPSGKNGAASAETATSAAAPSSTNKAVSYAQLLYLQSDRNWNCLLKLEPRSEGVVCNGYPGQLQVFSSSSKSIHNTYQVVNFTRISKKETNTKMYVPSITHFEFVSHQAATTSSSGHHSQQHYMVTVDVRKGDELDPETSLKFWEWNEDKASYRLTAQMDNPHGNAKISCIALTSTTERSEGGSVDHQVLCASASLDGQVKVWRGTQKYLTTPVATDSSTTVSGSLRWSCAYSFKYRDCPANCVSFSLDGSLLAVSYQNLLTLWDPVRVSLKGSLVGSSANNIVFSSFVEPKSSVTLGGGCGQALLVVGTRRSLSVFDLLTMKLVWSIEGSFGAFAVARSDAHTLRVSGSEAWIAVAATVKSKSSAAAGEDGTDGEASGVSEVEEAADAEGVEGVTFKVMLLGLTSGKPLASCTTSSKINSLVFARDSSGVSQVLVNTESNEVLSLRSSESSAGAATAAPTVSAQVTKKILPGLSAKGGLIPEFLMDVDEQHSGLFNTTASADSIARPHVHASKSWLNGIFDASSENIPSLSLVCDEFMDGLLRLKRPGKNSSNTTGANGKARSDSILSNSESTAAPLSIHDRAAAVAHPAAAAAVVDQPVNFDLLEREFDSSLLACFVNGVAPASSTGTSSSSASAPAAVVATPIKEAPKSAKKGKKAPTAAEEQTELTVEQAVSEATPTKAPATRKTRKGSMDSSSETESVPAVVAAPTTAAKKSSAAATAELLLAGVAGGRATRKRSMSNLSDASSVPSVSDEGTRRSTRTKK